MADTVPDSGCAGGILGRNKEKSENMRKFVSYSV